MNDAGGLQLHPFFGIDRSAHLAADDGLATYDVPLYFPAPGHENLLRGADRAVYRALYLHDPVRRDIAHHPHAGADDRQTGHAFAGATGSRSLFREHRHQRVPLSFTRSSGSTDLPS